ncbi:MAG: methionyl-tRNA formyltransferase [Candidatus Vogelbacteria bacterium]|nr:methionyl-tRNA formyltransferase [Candidatus Vogelbacteria bacterium]
MNPNNPLAGNKIKIAFFGTPDFSVKILSLLQKAGLTPSLIVTSQDEPSGRKLILTPSPVKTWAKENNIEYIQPESLKTGTEKILDKLSNFDLFIVAAYGKIIPKRVLNLPKFGTLNVHPSLLPKYRGAAPIQSAILNGDNETGTSIMLLDENLDHGPIIAHGKLNIEALHPNFLELQEKLAEISGQLLIETIPNWINRKITPKEQDHDLATFTKKIEKDFGFIPAENILDQNLPMEKATVIERKVRALNPDPGTFTIIKSQKKDIRVKITKARMENDKLIIERVVPEGKQEMTWREFLNGNPIN